MNALAHARPHARAHAMENGSVARTVHAKRREGKRPDRKGPDRTGPHQKYLSVETEHHGVAYVTRETRAPDRDAMMRCAEEPS